MLPPHLISPFIPSPQVMLPPQFTLPPIPSPQATFSPQLTLPLIESPQPTLPSALTSPFISPLQEMLLLHSLISPLISLHSICPWAITSPLILASQQILPKTSTLKYCLVVSLQFFGKVISIVLSMSSTDITFLPLATTTRNISSFGQRLMKVNGELF